MGDAAEAALAYTMRQYGVDEGFPRRRQRRKTPRNSRIVWITEDGRALALDDIDDEHLANIVRKVEGYASQLRATSRDVTRSLSDLKVEEMHYAARLARRLEAEAADYDRQAAWFRARLVEREARRAELVDLLPDD